MIYDYSLDGVGSSLKSITQGAELGKHYFRELIAVFIAMAVFHKDTKASSF
jgi:hypothetical protein